MKAAYLQNNHIHVGELPDPVPEKGQALVHTHSCGLWAVRVGCALPALGQQGGGDVAPVWRPLGAAQK
ncbi:MAG: hypothetical protein ACREJC_09935 [Tepidisphaeraceae bacterium]